VNLAFPFASARLDVEGHRLVSQDISDLWGRHFDELMGFVVCLSPGVFDSLSRTDSGESELRDAGSG
jgi:hypothetical protein